MNALCRVHKTPLMTDLNGVDFCRHCRHDRDALKQQVSAESIESADPQELKELLAAQLEAQS